MPPLVKTPQPFAVPRAVQIRTTVLALFAFAASAHAQGPEWIQQFGTSLSDVNIFFQSSATVDNAGGVYLCGETVGDLGGPNAGSYDAWLARYDHDGNQLWLRQFGSAGNEEAACTAFDSAGGVYVCGSTTGDLAAPNAGDRDAWIAHYDTTGNQHWVRQFGTSGYDSIHAAVRGGLSGVYVCGTTDGSLGGPNAGASDVFIAYLDNQGNTLWTLQFGSSGSDMARAAIGDRLGGLYLCGSTDGSLMGANQGGYDVWLARFDSTGSSMWSRQFGSSGIDTSAALCLDALGGVYLAGRTTADLAGAHLGSDDAWLTRYDSAGNQHWAEQLGTSKSDFATAIAQDAAGGVYLSGATKGSLGGPRAGLYDSWIRRYDSTGRRLWGAQLGTAKLEMSEAAAPDGSGGVFLFGWTYGALGGANAGEADAWLARFDEPCGSAASYCSASQTSLAGCQAALSARGSPSFANPGSFTIQSGPVPGGNLGLCLFGDQGRASGPLGTLGGLLCVQAPFLRTPPKSGAGSVGACDGAFAFTLQDLIAASTIVTPGVVIDAQIWARDPANPDGFLLSDGLEFTVCP